MVVLTMATPTFPCSRVVYLGPAGAVVTGRTMDWTQSMETNLWAFPAGLSRNGNAGPQSIEWTSKYGSVVATCYDGLSADPKLDGKRPALSIAGWSQYVLDNFATVAEAVAALKDEPFQLAGLTLPGGHAGTGHLSISDATGDSAVFEYLDGKLVIHHGKQFAVMTNDPPYEQQLALNSYWQEIGGAVMLPGTERPADRFVRASFYLGEAPQTTDETQQIATMFSIIRNVSVPFGAEHPGQPNVAATLWRTVSDQQRLTYYFEMTDRPNVFWVELKKLDLSPGQPIRMLPVEGAAVRAGEVSQQFEPAKQFAFMPGGDK
ncbi:MAG: linear amide C-N hydrolase [Planctomycetia bacterium]|nr:linear amide C-N hydrolase [Planctomycetia bacterium]